MTFETQLHREGEIKVGICFLKHLYFIETSAQLFNGFLHQKATKI